MDSIRKIGIETQGEAWKDLSVESRKAVVRAVMWCVNHPHALPQREYVSLTNSELLRIIDESVQEVFDLTLAELQARNKRRALVDARCMVMLIYRNSARATLSEIGEVFGLHHATVIHGIDQAKFLIDYDKNYREKYYLLKSKIEQKCEKLSTSCGPSGSSPELS